MQVSQFAATELGQQISVDGIGLGAGGRAVAVDGLGVDRIDRKPRFEQCRNEQAMRGLDDAGDLLRVRCGSGIGNRNWNRHVHPGEGGHRDRAGVAIPYDVEQEGGQLLDAGRRVGHPQRAHPCSTLVDDHHIMI